MDPKEDNDIIWAGYDEPVAAFDRHSSTLYLNNSAEMDEVSKAVTQIEYVSRNNYGAHWQNIAERAGKTESIGEYINCLDDTRMNVEEIDGNQLRALLGN